MQNGNFWRIIKVPHMKKKEVKGTEWWKRNYLYMENHKTINSFNSIQT